MLWKGGSLVFDILDLALGCEGCIFIQHVKREVNTMARNITKANGRLGQWEGC